MVFFCTFYLSRSYVVINCSRPILLSYVTSGLYILGAFIQTKYLTFYLIQSIEFSFINIIIADKDIVGDLDVN